MPLPIITMKPKYLNHFTKRVKEIVKAMKAACKAPAHYFLPAISGCTCLAADLITVSVSKNALHSQYLLRELKDRFPERADHRHCTSYPRRARRDRK